MQAPVVKSQDDLKESKTDVECTPFEQMGLDAYMGRIQSRIFKRWKEMRTRTPISATVHYKIKADGTLTTTGLKKSSGNAKFDENALRAVKKAAPFESVPEFDCVLSTMEDEQFELSFTFTSKTKNAFSHNPQMLRNNRLVIIKVKSPDKPDKAWIDAFKAQLKNQWDYVLPRSAMPVVIHGLVDANGNLNSLTIKKSSGDKKKDKEARKALEYSVPFDSLPEDFPSNTLPLEIRLF